MSTNNELYHYGVLGMKWGVRKNDYRTNILDSDVSRYGKKGAKRIAKRMSKKGVSRNAARRFEKNSREYGVRGAKRIEKRIKKGDKPQVAASKEFVRSLLIASASLPLYAALMTRPLETINIAKRGVSGIVSGIDIGKKYVDNFMLNNSLGKYKDIINVTAYEVIPKARRLL